MMDLAEEYREKLMDAVSSFDDDIAMMYLEGEEIPVDMIKAVIRKATIANEMVPVVCGTSYKNKGVSPDCSLWCSPHSRAGRWYLRPGEVYEQAIIFAFSVR